MQGEQDRRFGLHEVHLGHGVRCWQWRQTLEKGKDAFSSLTLLCAKVYLQFGAFSLLNTNVFAVFFDRTSDFGILSHSESKTHFGNLPVVCIWITVLIALLSLTNLKSEVQLLPESWDKKSWGGRGCPSIFWNIKVHKIRNLWERQEDTNKCIWKRTKNSRYHSCIPKSWNTGFKEYWVSQGPQ